MRRALDAGSSLSDLETTELARRIADLTTAGLPLPSGLRALAEELPRRRVRASLVRLADAMDAGAPLDAALASLEPRLPSYLRGMILAAARTGDLGRVLGRFAGYSDTGADLRRSVLLRLVPSIASLSFAIAIFVFGELELIPYFKALHHDLGAPPLAITRAMFAVSDAIQAVWRPVVQGLLIISACWALACLILPKEIRRGLLADIPVLGEVWRLTALAEFCHLLAILVECKVPLVEALPMAGEGVSNFQVASASRAAAAAVSAGLPFSDAMVGRSLFPRGMTKILVWSEGHRGLPDALHMLADLILVRARARAQFVGLALNISSVVAIFGAILFTIVLPTALLIYQLS